MVIFNHGYAAEDKGEEVREYGIHKGLSHGRRSFTTKRVSWIRSLEWKLQWRKRMRERRRKWHEKLKEQREMSFVLSTLLHLLLTQEPLMRALIFKTERGCTQLLQM